jgi:hypothetical protein
MIYLATNCDKDFYNTKPDRIIKSLLEYKSENMEIMFFQIDFDEKIDGIINVNVPLEKIKESKRFDIENRPWFVCLETGEFVNFYNFNDDDILILLDYDIIQQRYFNDYEINLVNNIKDGEFYLTKNSFTDDRNSHSEMNILCIDMSLNEDKEPFEIYNTGCQIAKISTWKKMYEFYKKIHLKWEEKCKHHATGQLIFNYIAYENDMIKELHPSFHSSWGFHGLKHFTRNKKFYVHTDGNMDNGLLVLFNHHVWNNDFL